MKIINKTPHQITIVSSESKITLEPVGEPIRLEQTTIQNGNIKFNGFIIPLTKTRFGKVENLPEREEGTIYIVSNLVCQACPNREDLFIVNETIRDEKGRIIGCKSLARNPFLKVVK